MNHVDFVKLAIKQMGLCPKGVYPKVGCVIAHGPDIVSVGHKDNVKHAERHAIEKIDPPSLIGSTLYTTLEPCVDMGGGQPVKSCAELIIDVGITSVYMGTYDPNGIIYTNGSKLLAENSIEVGFFPRKYQLAVQESSYKYNNFNRGVGGGKRRVRVTTNGKPFTVQFSEHDKREVSFTLNRLSSPAHKFDITGSNESIRFAPDAKRLSDVKDPLAHHDANHYARMEIGHVVTICSGGCNMAVVLQLVAYTETELYISWEVRNV